MLEEGGIAVEEAVVQAVVAAMIVSLEVEEPEVGGRVATSAIRTSSRTNITTISSRSRVATTTTTTAVETIHLPLNPTQRLLLLLLLHSSLLPPQPLPPEGEGER